MAGRPRKSKIEVNSKKSLTDLMQETYNNANDQMHKTQRIVNQLEASEDPDNNDPSDIAKIAKQKTDALKTRDSAIKIKLDLAKLQAEVLKHGDEQTAIESANSGDVDLNDFQWIRDQVLNKANPDKKDGNDQKEGNESDK